MGIYLLVLATLKVDIPSFLMLISIIRVKAVECVTVDEFLWYIFYLHHAHKMSKGSNRNSEFQHVWRSHYNMIRYYTISYYIKQHGNGKDRKSHTHQPHKRHPIFHPQGWAMGHVLWILWMTLAVIMGLHWTKKLNLCRSHIGGLVQDCRISSALALEILQSCTKAIDIWAWYVNTMDSCNSGEASWWTGSSLS